MPNQWTPPLRMGRDLGVNRKNGGEEQKGKESIQQNSFSVQKKQTYFQQSQWTSRTNNIEGEWGHDLHSNPIGCSLLPVHDQFKFPKENSKEKSQETAEITFSEPRPNKEKNKEKSQEISETGGITLSAPSPNLPMDSYNGTKSQKTTKNSQCLLEVGPGKDYQPCIWCINHNLQSGRQEKFMYTPERERPLSFSSGSVWKCDSETRVLGVRELRGDECLDFFMPVEIRSPNQFSNNISTRTRNNMTMQKLQSYSELVDTLKNDREFREFHGPTDGRLIDQENRKYFYETYGITYICPLFVDHSGMVVLFLDDRGILFAWCDMTNEMDVMGINKMEGLANYLYHPEKVCAIMEDTGELVPRVELTRRVTEKMAKKKLEEEKLAEEKWEKNKEKRLAKKKRLAEKKRLTEEKRLAEEK
ncbi:hypothetical protein C1645_741397 [Glomus cerebriforme]|uniref:Uncharacterized protein n=1 Tax=Glomus cerebriforme TaxID=658196 RepID=A0A397SJ56_9GLOM|nr:hypothetical protein C1645_741397 [Glomus cerebriforme]